MQKGVKISSKTILISLLVDVIIIRDPLKELGVLIMRWEPEGGRGLCCGNRIIIAQGTPMVAKAMLELVLGDDEALLNIMVLLTVESDRLHNSKLSLAQEHGKTSMRCGQGGRHGGACGLRHTSILPRLSRSSKWCTTRHAHMRRWFPDSMHLCLCNLKRSSVINQRMNERSMRELARLKKAGNTDLMPNVMGYVNGLGRLLMHTNHQVNAVVASP